MQSIVHVISRGSGGHALRKNLKIECSEIESEAIFTERSDSL